MNRPEFRTLLTAEGQRALQAAQALELRERDYLAHFQTLSRKFPAQIARPALETALLRQKAAEKFPQAAEMYFTREALEQATAWPVSRHRAARFAAFEQAFDFGCSIGSDSLSLAQHLPVIALDQNGLRLNMAQANHQAVEPPFPVHFVQADLEAELPLRPPAHSALFFDPARRSGNKRAFSVQQYQPSLFKIQTWMQIFPAAGVKISPGVKLEQIEHLDCEVEFVSLHGELKEAVLWFGGFQSAPRRATVLPGGHTLTSPTEPEIPLVEPQAYVYEPDPAIIRAGLVRTLGAQLNAGQLDRKIAYLTGPERIQTPFARCWAIEDWMPFHLKRLRAYLRQCGIGRVTVKKRGSPISPEELIGRLKPQGDLARVLFLTQKQGRPIVIIALENPVPGSD